MAAVARDLYEVLKVPRSASPASIRRAYRLQALATHPDKEGGKSDTFRSVVHAYEVLGSAVGRAAYDLKTQPQVPSLKRECNLKSQEQDPAGHRKRKRPQSERPSASVRLSEPTATADKASCHSSRKQYSLEGRMNSALEMLRCLLAGQDHVMKRNLLAHLSSTSRAALLKYMETWKSSSQHMVDFSVLTDGGINSCPSSDSESQSSEESRDALTPTLETLCDDDLHSEASFVGGISHPLPIEDATNMECRDIFQSRASPNMANSDTANATKGTMKRSSHGPVGISTYSNRCGKVYYVVRTSVAGVFMKSRAQASLEDAVSTHMVLVQVRDAFRYVLNRHGGSFVLLPRERIQAVVQELQEAAEGALVAHGVSSVPGFCSYSAKVSLRPYLGMPLQTPQTRSIATCIEHRQRLFQARSRGWDSLRLAFLEISTENIEARIPGSHGPLSASRSRQDVSEQIDAAYERYTIKRLAVEERIANRCRSKAVREDGRRAALQLRLIRRVHRMSQIVEDCVHDQAARKRKEIQANFKRKVQERMAGQLKQEREKSQRRKARWEWHHQRHLTMDDILRGPPF